MNSPGVSRGLQVERDGVVLILTLNRPERLNAIDRQTANALGEIAQNAEVDPTVRAVVLTGAGTQSFCVGGDLREMAQGARGELFDRPGGFAGLVELERTVPWIAAVNGYALGGGLELMLACDIVVAGYKASFGVPEVQLGLIAGAGGIARLCRTMPSAVAMEMVLTGDPISADQALHWGLVSRLVAPEELLSSARALAHRIAALPSSALKESLALAHLSLRMGEEAIWPRAREAINRTLAGEDSSEGCNAFLEGRAPDWARSE